MAQMDEGLMVLVLLFLDRSSFGEKLTHCNVGRHPPNNSEAIFPISIHAKDFEDPRAFQAGSLATLDCKISSRQHHLAGGLINVPILDVSRVGYRIYESKKYAPRVLLSQIGGLHLPSNHGLVGQVIGKQMEDAHPRITITITDYRRLEHDGDEELRSMGFNPRLSNDVVKLDVSVFGHEA